MFTTCCLVLLHKTKFKLLAFFEQLLNADNYTTKMPNHYFHNICTTIYGLKLIYNLCNSIV